MDYDRYAVGVNDVFNATSAAAPITVDVIANDYDLDEAGPGQGIAIDPGSVTLLAASGSVQVSSPNTITYTPTGNFCGNVVIRYRPYTISTGFPGSYATLLITIPCPGYCPEDPCNLICNGGFELGLTPALFDLLVTPNSGAPLQQTSLQTGWYPVPDLFGQPQFNTSDIYLRGTTVPNPFGDPWSMWDIPISFLAHHAPGVETPTSPNNNAYGGMVEGATYVNSIFAWSNGESMFRKLVTPLVPGATYTLTYQARAITRNIELYHYTPGPGNPSGGPAMLNVSFSTTSPHNNINNPLTQQAIQFSLSALADLTVTANINVVEDNSGSNAWTPISQTFTVPNNVSSQYVVLEPKYTDNTNTPSFPLTCYIFVDNIRLVRVADPQISITSIIPTPQNVNPGDVVTFAVKVCNAGTTTANNVTVQDYLPPGFVYVVSGTNDFNSSGVAIIPTLAPGHCVILNIKGKPDYNTVAFNTPLNDCATITSQNNCVQQQACGDPVNVLATNIILTTSQSPCDNNCSELVVTVANNGPVAAHAVKVQCAPALCLNYVANSVYFSPSGAATFSSPNYYIIPSLDPGQTVTMYFPVCPTTPGSCITANNATLTSMTEYDTNSADNASSIILSGCGCINLIRLGPN